MTVVCLFFMEEDPFHLSIPIGNDIMTSDRGEGTLIISLSCHVSGWDLLGRK